MRGFAGRPNGPGPPEGPGRSDGLDLPRRLAAALRDAPLPGRSAQAELAPAGRVAEDEGPPGALHAAVLLIVTAAERLIYIRRAKDGRAHSGQIAFPGGAREPEDGSLEETALRETEEEIGVPPAELSVLGALTPLYIPVSNFLVHPFAAYAPATLSFICAPSEAQEAIAVPIAALISGRASMDVERGGSAWEVPCYRHGQVEIWGATAMITAEFVEIWRRARVG